MKKLLLLGVALLGLCTLGQTARAGSDEPTTNYQRPAPDVYQGKVAPPPCYLPPPLFLPPVPFLSFSFGGYRRGYYPYYGYGRGYGYGYGRGYAYGRGYSYSRGGYDRHYASGGRIGRRY